MFETLPLLQTKKTHSRNAEARRERYTNKDTREQHEGQAQESSRKEDNT